MPPEPLPRMHVAHMHLHIRHPHAPAARPAPPRLSESGGGGVVAGGGLDAVDYGAFVVGLEGREGRAEGGGLRAGEGFDVGEGGVSVDVWLARAEEVEVGAVDEEGGGESGFVLWLWAMMTQMLEAQKNYYEKKLAEKSTKRQKTTFEKVPELKKKEDFLTWRDKLLTSLKSAGLEAHILTGVPEPADDDEKRQWRYDRIDVDNLIQSTIADINVWTLLRGQGWKVTDQDPKSTFDHLTQHFDKYTHKATYDIAREFFNIRRGDYDKFTTFQIRLNYLYQRINETDYKMQESAATLNAIQAISDAYPDLYTRSMTNLRNNKLSWADLMLEFNELASQEATQPALSNVKYGKDKTKRAEGDATSSSSNTRSTSMTNKNNERQNSWKSKNQRVDCKECDKDIYTGQEHCGGCGFHYPKASICWWCNPEQAPENWPKRDSALKAKATKTSSSTSTSLTKSSSASSSTTGPLHQQSGVANQSRPMNLLFTSNHPDMNMMNMAPHFWGGPWRN
ncbi:hypothetical protein CHGG_10851 [Chaetomium globosum CBS 148.51]|uniref:Uncharacterized protein n=1 Tax=Chaetomium globosum (strain ATCC 6205 / CBS 148.51 / DSM 1962 / NBRC 6347 / NRRL 1970) TaxID=306901 RepID=Q2GMF3_CHAGB|nr:uncharacterized protein CHGG_10851 [Chaetomium globosum CBS 148.51]EAQ83033.1 hypothetical protein CHGG_10851 [Chaetomium globosum CBS 148.51]